jgi:CRP/FNR family transcriptional regulator, cyclic AMP receptor protein
MKCAVVRSNSSSAASHLLAEVPLFAGLPPAALDDLARISRVRRYPSGQVLWNEGDPGDSLLVLEEGQLRISRFTASGQEAVLAVFEAPASLGELALLDGQPRDATVIAQRAVTVRMVPRTAFLALLQREPALVDGLLKTLAGLVRLGNVRHTDMLGLDVPGRLAKWLLRRAGDVRGSEVAPGAVVTLHRTQAELGAELGANRSTLNRALHELEDLGLIDVDGEQVTLLDPGGLSAFTL